MTTQDKIQTISDFYTMDAERIRKHVPEHPKTKPQTALRLLIMISANPDKTRTGLKDIYNVNTLTIGHAVNRLLELGMIRTKQKSRWIPGLHVWKVDIVHVITEKGRRILADLLS